MKNNKKIFLTFDLEEWPIRGRYKIDPNFEKNTKFSKNGTLKLMDLFSKYNIKCTFFVTGFFAQNEPEVIKLLSSKGHEIGSHSFANINLLDLSIEDIYSELSATKKLLKDLTGQNIVSFRAPFCWLTPDIIKILEKLDFKYDSSIHPAIIPGYYYNWKYPLDPYYLCLKSKSFFNNKSNGVLEIPISVIPRVRFPISWWWMRNLGVGITKLGMNMNLNQNRSVVLYFHPWEFDNIPRIKGIPYHLIRGCGKANLKRLEIIIKLFIKKYPFGKMNDFLAKE
ncbi:MAG: polysaccharide deacetylase family protein [Candidatus Omnitrophota bacterium]